MELLLLGMLLYIYDGDNIRDKKASITYRIATHDAPEIEGKCEAERRLAIVARNRLRELVKHPTAKLTPVACFGKNFNRKCAIVTVEGKNVSDTMIKERLVDSYSCVGGCKPRINWCSVS